ncbi:hypothetical protein C8Q80DRAFT_1123614 [Daedaleopsis nitida]|nr:hypothetical protein C8Q80DRAFT_1123614 [Daedaleopsis nitida]
MDRASYYQPRRGYTGRRSARTPAHQAEPQPPRPPLPPPPPRQPQLPAQEPQDAEQEGDEPPNKHPRIDVEPEDEEWADAMEICPTMLANGYKHLYDGVRNIMRLCGGDTANYANIISKGIELYDIDLKNPAHPYWACEDYDDIAEATLLFPIFVRHFPGLERHIDYLAVNNTVVQKLANFCTQVAKKSRGDDIGRVKRDLYKIAQWDDSRLSVKSNRGYKSPITGKLLTPPRLLGRFEANPTEFCRLVCKGHIKILSEDWPLLLYDMLLFRKGQQKPGLLKNELLIEMGKSMFTGFSSTDVGAAEASSGKGQPSVAHKHGMTSLNIHAILYVITLVRFSVTSHGSWEPKEGKLWDVKIFMQNILTFAHNNADWVDDIEGWWTKQIFGDSNEEDQKSSAPNVGKLPSTRQWQRSAPGVAGLPRPHRLLRIVDITPRHPMPTPRLQALAARGPEVALASPALWPFATYCIAHPLATLSPPSRPALLFFRIARSPATPSSRTAVLSRSRCVVI